LPLGKFKVYGVTDWRVQAPPQDLVAPSRRRSTPATAIVFLQRLHVRVRKLHRAPQGFAAFAEVIAMSSDEQRQRRCTYGRVALNAPRRTFHEP
jgi:hypothetical protein